MCSRVETVTRTARVKLHNLTERKRALLTREHETFNEQIHSQDKHELYSANRQQANRLDEVNKETQHPIKLRNDVFTLETAEHTSITDYWAEIPVYNPDKQQGDRINCPAHVPPHIKQDLLNGDKCGSELVREEDGWYLNYKFETQTRISEEYSDVLAVDLGARHMATTVLLSNRKTTFYGEKIRQFREHYKQLKKSVGKSKITSGADWISRKCSKEHKKVEQELYKIANSIVDTALEEGAVIAVGNLEGIREDNDKGCYVNDKTHKMPFARFVNILEYKAYLEGVDLVLVDEAYTSQTCNWCGEQSSTSRHGQGLFECDTCGLEENADKNGALNIGKRALGKDICLGLRSKADFPLSGGGGCCESAHTKEDNEIVTRVCLSRSDDEGEEPVNSLEIVEKASNRVRSPRL